MKRKKEKVIRQKDSSDEKNNEVKHMFELYTLVPPSPRVMRRIRKSETKK